MIPVSVSNYILGSFSVRQFDFFVGSLGIIFHAIFYVYLGTTISKIQNAISGSETFSTPNLIAFAVGLLIAIVIVVSVSIAVRKQLKQKGQVINEENNSDKELNE